MVSRYYCNLGSLKTDCYQKPVLFADVSIFMQFKHRIVNKSYLDILLISPETFNYYLQFKWLCIIREHIISKELFLNFIVFV